MKRHTLAVVFLVSLPSVVQAQNAVTVASGSSYTYSTNYSGQITSIANDDGSGVAYEYDAYGREIGINVSVGRTVLNVRYVQGWSGQIIGAPGLPALVVNTDANGRTANVEVHPEISISETGELNLDMSDPWTAATLTYATSGYLTQATLSGGLALQLAQPDANGIVHQTLYGSSGNVLAQANAVGSAAGVRIVPAQLDAVAAEFGFGSQWADTLTFRSTADGHLTRAYNANGQPVLYMVNAGACRVGFTTDGTPIFYDVEPNYEATAYGAGPEVSPSIAGVAPNHIIVTASGHAGFYLDRPAGGAIYSAWNELDTSGNERQSFAKLDEPSSSPLRMHAWSDRFTAHSNFIRFYQTTICAGGECWTRTWSEWIDDPSGPGGGGGGGGGSSAPPGSGGTPASKPGNQVTGDAALRLKVDRALNTASNKLKDPRCQQLLNQRDAIAIANPNTAGNRTLLGNMNGRGYTDPSIYLTRGLSYVAGSGSKCPGGSDTKASTSVWSTIIAVCPAFYNSSEGLAADYLIHEMLHSLGLPEYPTPGAKTSQQINDEVRAACGS